jgi:hypothetical protein
MEALQDSNGAIIKEIFDDLDEAEAELLNRRFAATLSDDAIKEIEKAVSGGDRR